MNPIVILCFLSILTASTISATPSHDYGKSLSNPKKEKQQTSSSHSHSVREMTKNKLYLAATYGHGRVNPFMSCDKSSRICRRIGSPGKDCCKNKCVNLRTDKLNCGKCCHKCKFPEICCKGKCVNPMKNKKNCGCCGKKCLKHHKCSFGICNYAN